MTQSHVHSKNIISLVGCCATAPGPTPEEQGVKWLGCQRSGYRKSSQVALVKFQPCAIVQYTVKQDNAPPRPLCYI